MASYWLFLKRHGFVAEKFLTLLFICNEQSMAINEAQWPLHFSMHEWLFGCTSQLPSGFSPALSLVTGNQAEKFLARLYLCVMSRA